MLTKDQEKILRWLLSLKTDIQNTITISNSMTEYPNGYTDKQIIKKLNEFENLGFITIKWYSPNHNDLNYAVDVTVLKDGINYFADKKKNRTSNKRDVPVYDDSCMKEYIDLPYIDWIREGVMPFACKRFNIGYSYDRKRIVIPERKWDGDTMRCLIFQSFLSYPKHIQKE